MVRWWRQPLLRRGLNRAWAAVGVIATLTGLWSSYGHFLVHRPPPVMRGTLNLAVADFDSADSRGGIDAKATAKTATDVATLIADRLGEELRPLTELRFEVRPPAQFPRIRGATEADRAAQVQARADEIDADIVVYGTLSTDGLRTVLQPRLYLADTIRADADELTGDHPWGTPLDKFGDPSSEPLLADQLSQELSARTKALAAMTIGVWYYRANDAEAAERYLQVAAKTPDWRDHEGKYVLFLFLGNTAERRGAQQQRQGHRRTARQSFAAAVSYYQRALAIDHQYARAYYGIAETKFLQVDLRCSREHTSRQQLQQVVDDFQAASRATNKPILTNINAKIAFGLGRAYVCMTVASVADRRGQAEQQLGVAIQALGDIRPDQPGSQRLREIVAEAYAQRGLLATTYAGMQDAHAHYLRAVEDYKQAIRLSADRPERQKVFQAALADIYDLLHMPREAEDARRKAP